LRPRDCNAGVARIVNGAPLTDRANERTTPLWGEGAHCAAELGA
jgi:hypothetical protein